MRHLIGILYLLTAFTGLYWSLYLTMTGIYGVPFSLWYLVIFIGGVLLLIGAILWWASSREWVRWLPLVGSGLLALYFVPAFIVVLGEGTADLIRVILVALVVASMLVAVRSVFRT